MENFIKNIERIDNQKQMEKIDTEIEYVKSYLKLLRNKRKRIYLKEYYVKNKSKNKKENVEQ